MRFFTSCSKALNGLAEGMGWLGWALILYCMFFGITDVFLRYVMNAPSLWIGTTVQAAMVLLACMTGAYAFKHEAFIKLDLFYANLTPRAKAICDVITSPFTFMFLGVLIWKGVAGAMLSIKLNQMTPTAVPIPIYPIKSVIPIAAMVVLLLVIQKLIHDIRLLLGSEAES